MSNSDSSTDASSPFDDEPLIEAVLLSPVLTQPRLSILHLMVWTATSAAMMALMRLPREVESQIPAHYMIGRIVLAMYGGVALGGVAMAISRWFRKILFPTEPGEWLLLLQGE